MKVNSTILVENYGDIGCNLREGYAPTIVQPKRYLGKKKSFDKKSTFSVTKFIENGEDAQSFLRWWRDDIEFGTLPFYIELPVMGGLMKTQVVMQNDLSPLMLGDITEAVKVPMSLKMISDIPKNTISITGINKVGGADSCAYDDPEVGCTVQTVYMVEVLGSQQGDINYKWTARGATIVAGQGTDTVTIETYGTSDSSYGITCDVSDDVYTLYANITGVHIRTSDTPVPITISELEIIRNGEHCEFDTANGCQGWIELSPIVEGDVVGSLTYLWEVTDATILQGQGTNLAQIATSGDVQNLSVPYSVTLTISDAINTDSMTVNRTWTRTNVNEAPVITLVGGDLALSVGDTYTEFGATAADVGDGDLTSEIVIAGSVDTDTEGTYQVTYNVSDSLGLDAIEVVRNVAVAVVVNEKPVITMLGSNNVVMLEGEVYLDAGATAYDPEDGNLTSDIIVTSDVQITVGNYTVKYNVSDSEGLAADEVVRNVEVVAVSSIQFELEIASPVIPEFMDVEGGDLIIENNGDGTWKVYSYDAITLCEVDVVVNNGIRDATVYRVKKGDTLTSYRGLCYAGHNLTTVDILALTGVGVTDMSYMFGECRKLNVPDIINHLDTSSVTNWEGTLYDYSAVEYLDFTNVSFASADKMRSFLTNSAKVICISNLDTRVATDDLSNIFDGCTALLRPNASERASLVAGANWVNDEDCPNTTEVPNAPTGFVASNNQVCKIVFTWTNSTQGNPVPTYEIWAVGDTSPLATGVSSGDDIKTNDTNIVEYYVKAVNTVGSANSNTNEGEAVDGSPVDFTISASGDLVGEVEIEWDNLVDHSYDLYWKYGVSDTFILQKTNIGSSPYTFTQDPTIGYFMLIATNSCASKESSEDAGASLEIPTDATVNTNGTTLNLQVENTSVISFDRSDWRVMVDGVERFGGSVSRDVTGIDIGLLSPPVVEGAVVTVEHDVIEDCITDFTGLSVTNNSTISPPLAGSIRYEMDSFYTQEVITDRPKVIITTDIGGDEDDQQSLVYALMYSNTVDIKAIVVTGSTSNSGRQNPELVTAAITAYSEVEDNLRLHDSDYPNSAYFTSITKNGSQYTDATNVGSGHDTDGSEIIISAVDDVAIGETILIQLWGAQTDLAQALYYVKVNRTITLYDQFIAKILVHDIYDQTGMIDDIMTDHPNLKYILNYDIDGLSKSGATRGMYLGGDGDTITEEWLDANVRGNGALTTSTIFPKAYSVGTGDAAYGGIKAGDNGSFHYALGKGLSNMNNPEYGGWGGRFIKEAGQNYWTSASDDDGAAADDMARATMWKWRPTFQTDFAARLKWCLGSYAECNHHPIAVLNSVFNEYTIQQIDVDPLDVVTLSAVGSSDPDGRSLSYRWWQYEEAGSYDGEIIIDNSTAQVTSFTAPDVGSSSKTIHVILEVTNNGTPALTSYRRLIVVVSGS